MPTFFLTAAEHSGDALGASLIHALRRRVPDAVFVGVGGEKMAAAGCRLLANPVTRSAMLVGALFTESRYWWKLLGEIRREFRTLKPDAVIPIDSSAINLRIARVAQGEGLPVCYYVAPQVWASRPWRVKKIAASVDTLCCILPFEEAYFRERRVNSVYVGHPMFDRPADAEGPDVGPPLPASTGAPRIALFPGSRRAEVAAHLRPIREIVVRIREQFPEAAFIAAAPSAERAAQIREFWGKDDVPIEVRTGEADRIIRWADLVLTKSGTATLQIARHHKPMVVMYAVAWWKWHLFARFLINTPYIALVNILAGREIVPEYIPFYGSPRPIAEECVELLADAEKREQMSRELRELVAPLLPQVEGVEGLAAERVALQVLNVVQKSRK